MVINKQYKEGQAQTLREYEKASLGFDFIRLYEYSQVIMNTKQLDDSFINIVTGCKYMN